MIIPEVGTSDRIPNSDIPLAIGLSNSYRNIRLTYLSDFNYRTSWFGLPIIRWLSELLQSIGQKMANFYSVYVFFSRIFHHSGVHIVLLASLLMLVLLLRVSLLLLRLWCSYCLSCCGLLHAVAGCTVFTRIPALIASILCWRSCCCFHSCCCLRSCCCERSWYCVLYVPEGFLVLVSLLLLTFLV